MRAPTVEKLQRELQASEARLEAANKRIEELREQVAHLKKAQIQLRFLTDGTGGKYCGVYVLMKDGQPLYAGRSVNVFKRIVAHRSSNSMVRGDFDEVRIIWIDYDDLHAAERDVIAVMQPKLNVRGNTQPYMRTHLRGHTPAEAYGEGFVEHHVGRASP